MSRALVVVPACLVALALVVGGAACSSTLNLGSESDGGGAGAAVDSAAPTCGSACERIISTCRLVAPDQLFTCLGQCKAKGRPSDLRCLFETPCERIPTVCGDRTVAEDGSTFGPDPNVLAPYEIMICQNACDHALQTDCLSVAEHAACRTQCASTPSAKRTSYSSCEQSSFGNCPRSHDCLALFVKD